MTARLRSHASYFRLSVSSFARVMLSATLLCTAPVYAQTFTVLHSFTDQGDGGYPLAGVSIDRGGNLFGTNQGGIHGILYELAQRNGNWILNPLLKFDGSDGAMDVSDRPGGWERAAEDERAQARERQQPVNFGDVRRRG